MAVLAFDPGQRRATLIVLDQQLKRNVTLKPPVIPTARSISAGNAGNAAERNQGSDMGLYKNIQKKRARIKAGSGEKMRKPGTKGAPTAAAFKAAAKTAKRKK